MLCVCVMRHPKVLRCFKGCVLISCLSSLICRFLPKNSPKVEERSQQHLSRLQTERSLWNLSFEKMRRFVEVLGGVKWVDVQMIFRWYIRCLIITWYKAWTLDELVGRFLVTCWVSKKKFRRPQEFSGIIFLHACSNQNLSNPYVAFHTFLLCDKKMT